MKNFPEIKSDIRYLKDIEKVILDKNSISKIGKNTELYYMYRGLKTSGGIRYDITIIPPLMIGKEYNRTFGHFHKENFGEIYKVIDGKAIFYLQDKSNKEIFFVKAGKNEFIAIPKNFGHITINASDRPLIMSNLVSEKCKSDYSIFKKLGGPAYFFTKKGWIKNENYKNCSKLKTRKPLKTLPKNWKQIIG